MSNILKVIARVAVPDLSAATPFYRRLSDDAEVSVFGHAGVELASVGPFLLLSGPEAAAYDNRRATVLVRDLRPVADALKEGGGSVLEGPGAVAAGERMIVRHPDGAVFEYIRPGG